MNGQKTIRLDSGQIERADEAMVKILRQKTPAERIAVGFNIWISCHDMLRTHLKNSHPGWNNKQIEKEVLRRFAGGTV